MLPTPPAPRAAIYARVSTTDQRTAMQVEELRQVGAQRGWVVVGEYVDEGVSGGKQSRPALDELMHAVQSGDVDVVAVWRFDRFARSTQHLLSALEEFRTLGVGFVSVREAIDTSTPVGKMIFTMVAAIAEFEKSLIQERVRAGVSRARGQGKHCGRPRRDIDLDLARLLMDQGHGIRRTARMMGIAKTTLARHLSESGGVSRKSVPVGKA